ncbi:MAG: hypothetical protein QN137_09615, partial [Armatimonadota bacterium]|nr:hypothetical protein [Armatimonadota bacterium]
MNAPMRACAERVLRADAQQARVELVALVVDGERAVEALVDLDPRLGVAAAPRTWQDLQVVGGQRDRVDPVAIGVDGK